MAAEYNFPAIIRTNTFRLRKIKILKNETPIDLTGASVCMQLKSQTSTVPVHTFGSTISDALAGEITLAAWQVNLAAGTYNYDLKITMPDGFVLTYLKGVFPVHQNISECQ